MLSGGANRKALILALLAGAALALFLFAPSVGRPQRESAFHQLQEAPAGSAAVSSTPTAGSETPSQSVAGSAVPGFSAGDMAGLALRLLLVAGIIAGSLFVLKLYSQKLRTVSGSTGVVRVLDTLGLASGRVVYVLDAGEKVLLIGATQTQISLLGEITGKETITALRTAADLRTAPGTGLWDAVRGLTSRISMPAAPAREAQPSRQPAASAALRRLMESHRELRARLDELQGRSGAVPGGEP